MIRMLLIATIATTCTVDSCNHPELPQQLEAEYVQTRDACIAHGGVPVEGTIHDTNTDAQYRTVVRCEWPKKAEQDR